jgi:catechol 2,3-dioxygenase-like lactoylglutathione lyase family enzyme
VDAAIKDVGAIILFVEDLQRSKAFYHGVLGLDVEFEDDESVGFKVEGLTFIVLQVDRARVQLQGEPTATPGAGATAFLTTFTDDVDALHATLVERRVSFFQRPTDQPWGMRTAYFKDPDGHVWEIAQPIQRSDS